MPKDGKVKVSKMIKLLSSYPKDADVKVEVALLNDNIPEWVRVRILDPIIVTGDTLPVICVEYFDDDPWTEV